MSINPVSIGLPGGVAGWKMLQTKSVADFKAFSRDPGLLKDIAYLRENLPTKASAKDMLADRRLQEMVLTAYGLESQVGMDALMKKVLESDTNDTGSVASRMVDGRYRKIAGALNYGGLVIPKVAAVASTATVQVDNAVLGNTFTNFTGTFGGIKATGVSLDNLNGTVAIAAVLQAAFRRADGKATDISVKALGGKLLFTDAKGRGTAKDFSFTAAEGSAARAGLAASIAGSREQAAIGGTKVKDSATVDQVVSLYTQMRFEESLGETSESLRKAVYAKRNLPSITSWYSIIGDRNLAAVVQDVLGFPASFGSLDVDRQKAMLESRMKLSDFKDSTKLNKMLDRYVAKSSVAEAQALSSSSGIATLVQPISWGGDSFNGSSAAALYSIING